MRQKIIRETLIQLEACDLILEEGDDYLITSIIFFGVQNSDQFEG